MSITDLQPGQSMVVARLESSDRPRLYKLLALGILPGVVLTLRRRSPCYLIDVGQAQLALDASAAGTIFGQRNG